MKSVLWVLLFASATALAQSNPVPFINQPLVPTSTLSGGSAFMLTLNGTGFVSGAVVNWNGTGLATTFVNSSQVTAIVPASDIANAGTASVTVTNPAPGGGTSNVQFFGVHAPISTLAFTNYLAPSTISGSSIITADFNRDGIPDLAYWSNNSVFVQLGNGDFTFRPAVSYAVGNSAGFPVQHGIVAADFNGDSKLDLAVTGDSTVSILLGNGDGTFQPQITSATGFAAAVLVPGDFNADGKLDLAFPAGVLLGNGDGTFQPPIDFTTELGIYEMQTGDFNRDGKLDLIGLTFNNLAQGYLVFLQGNGDGTFQPAVTIYTFASDWDVRSLLVADLNQDDKLDVVAVGLGYGAGHGDTEAAYVFLGNGDGTFQSPVDYPNQFFEMDTGVVGAALGDFNAKGKFDFAYITTNSGFPPYPPGSLTILPGNGDGTFQGGVNFPASSNFNLFGLAAGDFNRDGNMDFVNNPNGSNIPLFVAGQYPLVGLSSPFLNAPGPVNVGSSASMGSLTVTNIGSATLAISQVSISGPNAQDFGQTNNCIGNLAPNASCQVNATFSPVEPGNLSATLNIFDDALGGSPQKVALSGTAVAPVVSLSPRRVTFADQYVGTSGLPQTVTVTNTGTAALTITNVTTSIADFGPLSNCTNPVPPNTNCTIGVFFDPTASGTRGGNLIITDNASGSPQTVPLTGTGQDFALSAPSPSQTVSPGQTATYSVTVDPAGGFKQTVQLSCTGAPAQSSCSVSPSSVTLNGTASQPVTVTVTTTGSMAGLTKPWFGPPSSNAYGSWMWWFGTLGLVGVVSLTGWRGEGRRRWVYGLASVCVLCIGMTLSGCGGSSGGGGGGGIQAGTYNLAVTGSFSSGSTKLTHSTNLTLVVQ